MQIDTDTVVQAASPQPSFNLWDNRWIGVVLPDGAVQQVGILECLTEAHKLGPLQDQSPLVVAATHRLLAAILQDIYKPKRVDDIAALLTKSQFDPARIEAYADQYRARFDLFSEDAPFMQSAAASQASANKDELAFISVLFVDAPSATNVVHFLHIYDDAYSLCAACAAAGLITRSTFEIPDGPGYKSSINGWPPVFVFPAGATLFETLTLMLVIPPYQPAVRSSSRVGPVWTLDETVVPKASEVLDVGYLESLTFPTRHILLMPPFTTGTCSRCGRNSAILISKLVRAMGKYRSKESPLWQDPFVAYHQKGDNRPQTVRPLPGKVLWREYATLFLSVPGKHISSIAVDLKQKKQTFYSPAIVSQLADLEREGEVSSEQLLRFRCIGVRTEGNAKIHEWVDQTMDLPVGLLRELDGAREVRLGIERAEQVELDIKLIFQQHFKPDQKGKRDRYKTLRERMTATYWTQLSPAFSDFIMSSSDANYLDMAVEGWIDVVIRVARECFEEAVEEVGDRGSDLRGRVRALQACRIRLATRRKEWTDGNS